MKTDPDRDATERPTHADGYAGVVGKKMYLECSLESGMRINKS